MKIKALFVDLGGVLILNRATEVGLKYEKSEGLTPEVIRNTFRYIQTAKRSDVEIETYLKNEGVSIDLWKKYLADFYNSETKNFGLIELLNKAKEFGIKIVYTTNNSKKLEDLMKKYQIDNIPNLIINSSEARVAKPDPIFWTVAFREARKLLPNLEVKDVLVIDDSATNCESATNFGFNSFRYVDDSESQKKISEMIF